MTALIDGHRREPGRRELFHYRMPNGTPLAASVQEKRARARTEAIRTKEHITALETHALHRPPC
ncbi:MAG: hypothetical protein ACTS1Z_13800 [Parasphingopyxis sp.]|uniref:hypothetical protein n=1 Tax=Parasphingopyxis sp. TaxID=1920299 RepID=UPI003F9EF5E5